MRYSSLQTEEYPEGIRYSFQAHRSGETVVRYDNYNKHAGSRHHKHIGEEDIVKLEEQPESKQDILELYEKFIEEVERHD